MIKSREEINCDITVADDVKMIDDLFVYNKDEQVDGKNDITDHITCCTSNGNFNEIDTKIDINNNGTNKTENKDENEIEPSGPGK